MNEENIKRKIKFYKNLSSLPCLNSFFINKVKKYNRRLEKLKDLKKNQEKTFIIIQNQLEILKTTCLDKTEQYKRELTFLQSLWRYEGSSKNVINFCQYFLFCQNNTLPDLQLTYLTCLLEIKQEETALAGLKDYISKYQVSKIEEYLPLASFSQKNGFTSRLINFSAVIFDHIESNRKGQYFEKWLKNKKIAVVGNSSVIIGKNLGKEIDSHQVVMRMNTFNITKDITVDLGKKTDVYVNQCNFEVIFSKNNLLENCIKYQWIYIAINFWHIRLSDFTYVEKFLEQYSNLIKNNIKISYFYPDLSISLKKESHLAVATTGLKIIWFLHKNNIDFDIYGFNNTLKKEGYIEDSIVKSENGWGNIEKTRVDHFTENIITSDFYRNKGFYDTGHNYNEELRFRNKLFSSRT